MSLYLASVHQTHLVVTWFAAAAAAAAVVIRGTQGDQE